MNGFIHILDPPRFQPCPAVSPPPWPLHPTVLPPFFHAPLQVFYSNQFSRKASAPVVLLLGVAMFVYVSVNLLIAEAKEGVA